MSEIKIKIPRFPTVEEIEKGIKGVVNHIQVDDKGKCVAVMIETDDAVLTANYYQLRKVCDFGYISRGDEIFIKSENFRKLRTGRSIRELDIRIIK